MYRRSIGMAVQWLKRLFTRQRYPTPPVLLRVCEANGDAPPVLDVETRWSPSGKRIDRSVRTADGLAVVHWLIGESEVEMVVRSARGEATLTIHRDQSNGRTFDLELTKTESWSPNERVTNSVSAC